MRKHKIGGNWNRRISVYKKISMGSWKPDAPKFTIGVHRNYLYIYTKLVDEYFNNLIQ